ncbi:MAG: peptide deformylase [Planctomycetota bacterium]|nr:peptide deformylase [Planctomycetota bacterium]
MQIIKYPHPTLRHKSKPLRRVDAALRKIIAEMLELMYDDHGVGLAANQVDLPYCLAVINIQSDPQADEEELVLINPVISKRSGAAEADEGCLSLPEVWAPVRRPDKIELIAYDLSGNEQKFQLDGLYARAVQHEIDHLDGVLFIDRLSPTAKLSVKDPLSSLERQFASDRDRGFIPDDEEIARRLAELEGERT